MSTDRETTRIVRSWLEEGVTALPDRVLDLVLDQVPATPQRRSWWPSWRFTQMNDTLKLALGAAAVLVVALVGYTLMPKTDGVGAPTETAAPTPSPSPVPSLGTGALEPGTYSVSDESLTAVPFAMTVPTGWAARSDGYVYKNGDTPTELGLFPFNVTHVYTDACKSQGTLTKIGPTVDDLVRALEDQAGSDATTPVDVTIGGYPGKRMDMSIPADLDMQTCRHPDLLIQIWADAAETGWFAIPADYDGPNPVWIVDVDGKRAVFLAGQTTDTSTSDVAELQGIIDSITFKP
jgi:hypothetical protein